MHVRVVKINKKKSPLEGSQEATGGVLMPSTPCQLQTQQEKRHLVGDSILLSQQEEGKVPPAPETAQPMRDCNYHPANEGQSWLSQ